MLGRQKQGIEAVLRAQQFIEQHRQTVFPPPRDSLAQELDDVAARITRAATHQARGRRESLAATEQLRHAVKTLRDRHLKPIALIAEAVEAARPGIRAALRLPPRRQAVTLLLAHANGIRQAVAEHADLMVLMGRSPDFVIALHDAMALVARMWRRRERARSLQVGATAALAQHLGTVRRLIAVVDCQVAEAFEGNAAVLAEWHSAKRVHAKPGIKIGGTAPAESMDVDQSPQSEQPAQSLELVA